MYMWLVDKINSLKISVYKLSKKSGIPYSTLQDIVIGKSSLIECNGRTLLSLSKSLNVTIEELLSYKQEEFKPEFDRNIPSFLYESINNLKKTNRKKCDIRDCYLLEVNININICEVENLISKEHADYLRRKYL